MHTVVKRTLQEYSSLLDTKVAEVAPDLLDDAAEILGAALPAGRWIIACDARTREAAGERVETSLTRAGLPWTLFEADALEGHLPASGRHHGPACDDPTVDAFERALGESGAVAAISVGSGTITDVVKLAAYRAGIPMAAIATAPSMNGYTSAIAALLSRGVKTTVPCRPPRVVLADTTVLAAAPERMIQSGLGDLLSKPVSNADWTISAELGLSEYSPQATVIIERGSELLEGVASRLPERDVKAVGRLTESLLLSGFAMSVAGGSAPASGGEHLVSHYIDMTALAGGIPHDFHGCQVGVGTLAAAQLYEHLRGLDPGRFSAFSLAQALTPWQEYTGILQGRFGDLYEAVATHARAGYPDKATFERHINLILDSWNSILSAASRTLRTAASIEAELLAAGCPTRFSDIGVDPERAYRAIAHSKDIRNRYTVLHLAWELGVLEDQASQIAARLAA